MLGVDSEFEARMCERADTLVCVVHTLNHTFVLELMYDYLLVFAILAVIDELGCAGLLDADFNALVNVTVCVTGDSDGLLPVLHYRLNPLDGDGCAEHGTVKHGANSAVGALPHLVELVLGHALCVGSNGRALNGHAILLCSFGSLDSYLVAGLVTLGKAQVIIFCLEVNEGEDEFVFNHLPENTGHFIAVHLHDGSGHFNLFHWLYIEFKVIILRCGLRNSS